MTERMLVVHGTHLLVRGFHSTTSDRRSDAGDPTGALFVLTRALRRAIDFKAPARGLAVVDEALGEAPDPLRAQHECLPRLLEAHGLPVVTSSRSIDLVASATEAAVEAGLDVVVVGSDKRLAQLVSHEVWWYDAYKDVRYTAELVRKRFEVGPDHVAEWLALVGDDDTLPGVKGIGKKGATSILHAHGSVAAALAVADSIGGRAGNALVAAGDEALRQVERARLRRDEPLPRPLEALTMAPADGLAELDAELGFWELIQGGDEPTVAVEVIEGDAIAEVLEGWADEPVSVEAVVDGPSPVQGTLVGLALVVGERAIYSPLPAEVPDALATFLEDAARPKVGHDVKAAQVALAPRGVEMRGVVADSGCASHLHEPSNLAPHDLPRVARAVLRRVLPDEDGVRGVGKRRKAWRAVPAAKTAAWAAERAAAAGALWEALAPTTDRALLDEYLALSETLVRMERWGLRCDADDLEATGRDFEAAREEIEREVHAIAGREFNLNSTKQLGGVLFDELGLTVMKRTKTGWSTATDALERIAEEHPVVPLVIRYRRLRWLQDQWVTSLLGFIDEDGRVRSTFSPARSFSGRIVNAQPDLGRVPAQDDDMLRIRRAFRAPEGKALLSVDYNQLGLHVLAHLSEDAALLDPLRARRDVHRVTAAAVLAIDEAAVTPDQRQTGKLVNFATFAGQGASALAQQLGVSAQRAKVLIDRFDDKYARVRTFQDEQLVLAQDRGWVETLAGRRWPIGGLASRDPMERSYAERLARRATHEGSVADVSRRGLLRADQALRAQGFEAQPLLQVHDEVLFEVPVGELQQAAEAIATAMVGGFDLRAPLRVGCKAGPNWADLEPLDRGV